MKKSKFTIFTPTYNRAYILTQLYNSLLNQTCNDFEWLIIDDGSTDNTESLIKGFITEDKIKIVYHKQKNQGKHIAINNSFNFINTDYFITVDSDDHLLPNAIEKCIDILNDINKNDKIAGFTFFNYLGSDELDLNDFGDLKTFDYNQINFNIKGENTFVLETDIAKKYKFPIFNDEKFCQEAYMLIQILTNYKILYTNYILAKGEYLEDGLSQNIYKRMMMNPKYSLATLKIKYKSNLFNKNEKNHFALNYWDISIKSKKINILNQLLDFPLKGTLYYIRKKLFK